MSTMWYVVVLALNVGEEIAELFLNDALRSNAQLAERVALSESICVGTPILLWYLNRRWSVSVRGNRWVREGGAFTAAATVEAWRRARRE